MRETLMKLCTMYSHYRVIGVPKINNLGQGRPNYGPQALSGPPQWKDFIVIFIVWLLVTRINCLARFRHEWGYRNVISSKRKANSV